MLNSYEWTLSIPMLLGISCKWWSWQDPLILRTTYPHRVLVFTMAESTGKTSSASIEYLNVVNAVSDSTNHMQ